MKSGSSVRLREFLRYEYKDPAEWLRAMGEMNSLVARSSLPYKVRSLRTHTLRQWHEIRQAALFAYGMSQRMPECRFDFAHAPNADYDAVVRWQHADEQHFTAVQLKEYVPSGLNAKATLAGIFDGLTRYRDSRDLVVAVFLNRRLRLEEIICPSLNLGGLYLFGAAAPDQSRWFVIGDLLDNTCSISTFSYPA